MITLPTQKVPATSTNPQYLVLYGLPKAGKTSAVAQLENNLTTLHNLTFSEDEMKRIDNIINNSELWFN